MLAIGSNCRRHDPYRLTFLMVVQRATPVTTLQSSVIISMPISNGSNAAEIAPQKRSLKVFKLGRLSRHKR